MVDSTTKIAGTTRLLRGTFYSGGNNTKASLTTSLSASNSNLNFQAKKYGVNGNDISLQYVDTGQEETDFKLEVKNSQDISITLERKHSRAYFTTNNLTIDGQLDDDANVTFIAAATGSTGNAVSVALTVTSTTPVAISSVSVAKKVATITCGAAHGLAVGDMVGISGLNNNYVNGCFLVASVTDTTHFTVGLLSSITIADEVAGFGLVSKGTITVSSNDITILSPVDFAGAPMITALGLCKMWGRFPTATAKATCHLISDDATGDKRIGYISKRYLTDGKDSAITTTALDIKRAIEEDTTANELVNVFIPSGQTGMGYAVAMDKTYLSGGSNMVITDPDDFEVTVKIYDAWENLLATIESADITRVTTGVYQCVYTPDDAYRKLYIEFSGLIEDEPVLSRQEVLLDWAISETTGGTTTNG